MENVGCNRRSRITPSDGKMKNGKTIDVQIQRTKEMMDRHDQRSYGAIRLRLLTPYEKVTAYLVTVTFLRMRKDISSK